MFGSKKQLLLVDDDEALVKSVVTDLKAAGHDVTVAATAPAAERSWREDRIDLVILDISLAPSEAAGGRMADGIDLLRMIRRESDVPVIMLTRTDVPSVKVLAFELGADDYVTKPFHSAELVARVGAVFRRGAPAITRDELFLEGRLTIDRAARQVIKDGSEVRLTPTEFEILESLMEASGRAVTRRHLLECAHSVDHQGDERMVDVHVRHLRSKIEDESSSPTLILTVRGVGYRWGGTRGR